MYTNVLNSGQHSGKTFLYMLTINYFKPVLTSHLIYLIGCCEDKNDKRKKEMCFLSEINEINIKAQEMNDNNMWHLYVYFVVKCHQVNYM